MKDYEKLNYFLPIHCGAPDYKNLVMQFSNITSKSNLGSYIADIKYNLGSYIAGLWEGDGHVWIPKTIYSPAGHKYTPHLCITFAENDYPLVLKLKIKLGGSIRFKKENHAYVLTLSSLSDLNNIINLINGYLRGPKIEHFRSLINWMNKHNGSNFICKNKDTTDLFKNSWLSGFIDAEGSFDIRVSLIKNGASKNRVAARFRLEQQKIDIAGGSSLSYLDLFTTISKSLSITLTTSIHNGNKEYYLINLSSQKSRSILVKYLNNYQLFTSKLLNFKDWQECHELITNNSHLSNIGIEKALLLKSKMNKKRTYYNGGADHLYQLNNI